MSYAADETAAQWPAEGDAPGAGWSDHAPAEDTYTQAQQQQRAEDDGQFNISDIVIGWIGDSERIGYQQLTAIEIPDLERRFSLYHRVLHAFFIPYRTCFYDGRDMTQEEQVTNLIENLCGALDNTVSGKPGTPSYYSSLLDGRLPTLRVSMSEYTPEGMRKKIASQAAGCGDIRPDESVIEYLSMVLKIGILVLDVHRRDIVPMDCNRRMREYDNTVVLTFHRRDNTRQEPPHFMCVALVPHITDNDLQEEILDFATTLFATSHPFIQALHARSETVHGKVTAMLSRH